MWHCPPKNNNSEINEKVKIEEQTQIGREQWAQKSLNYMLEPKEEGKGLELQAPKELRLSLKETVCSSWGGKETQGAIRDARTKLELLWLGRWTWRPPKAAFLFFMTQRKSGMNSLDMKCKEVSGLYLEYFWSCQPCNLMGIPRSSVSLWGREMEQKVLFPWGSAYRWEYEASSFNCRTFNTRYPIRLLIIYSWQRTFIGPSFYKAIHSVMPTFSGL